MGKVKRTIIDAIENHDSQMGKWTGYFLITIIIASTIVFVMETTDVSPKWQKIFHYFDMFTIYIFSIEYVLRILIARRKSKVILSPLGLIDLFVLLSFYVSYLNLSVLRAFRVFRILQILKVVRYSDILRSFFKSFRHYQNEVKIFLMAFSMVLLLSSSGIYYLERGIDGTKFETIPDALWWSIVTVSSLGYGDMVPVTTGGKILTGFVVMWGLASIAIMTAVITKVFIDHFFGKRTQKCNRCHYPNHDYNAKFCKNCGAELEI